MFYGLQSYGVWFEKGWLKLVSDMDRNGSNEGGSRNYQEECRGNKHSTADLNANKCEEIKSLKKNKLKKGTLAHKKAQQTTQSKTHCSRDLACSARTTCGA